MHPATSGLQMKTTNIHPILTAMLMNVFKRTFEPSLKSLIKYLRTPSNSPRTGALFSSALRSPSVTTKISRCFNQWRKTTAPVWIFPVTAKLILVVCSISRFIPCAQYNENNDRNIRCLHDVWCNKFSRRTALFQSIYTRINFLKVKTLK